MDENPNRAPRRRFFSFTIRELLLLTVIVAIAVGWWLEHRKPLPPATPTSLQVGRWQILHQRREGRSAGRYSDWRVLVFQRMEWQVVQASFAAETVAGDARLLGKRAKLPLPSAANLTRFARGAQYLAESDKIRAGFRLAPIR